MPSDAALEPARLFVLLTAIRHDIQVLEERIMGLRYTPKQWRKQRLEEFLAEREAKVAEEKTLLEQLRALPVSQPQHAVHHESPRAS